MFSRPSLQIASSVLYFSPFTSRVAEKRHSTVQKRPAPYVVVTINLRGIRGSPRIPSVQNSIHSSCGINSRGRLLDELRDDSLSFAAAYLRCISTTSMLFQCDPHIKFPHALVRACSISCIPLVSLPNRFHCRSSLMRRGAANSLLRHNRNAQQSETFIDRL